MTALLVALPVAALVAAAVSTPCYADGSRVPRGRRNPLADLAALVGFGY